LGSAKCPPSPPGKYRAHVCYILPERCLTAFETTGHQPATDWRVDRKLKLRDSNSIIVWDTTCIILKSNVTSFFTGSEALSPEAHFAGSKAFRQYIKAHGKPMAVQVYSVSKAPEGDDVTFVLGCSRMRSEQEGGPFAFAQQFCSAFN